MEIAYYGDLHITIKMKNKIDYKKIYKDIKGKKLYEYYDLYINDKSEYNIRLYVLGVWCKSILEKYLITEKECISLLKNTNTLINIRIE